MVEFSAEVIDRHVYDELKDLMGESGFREVIDLFIADTRCAIDNLCQAVEAQQFDYVGAVCHKLKSSSKLVGAVTMTHWCEYIEAGCEGDQQNLSMLHACTQLSAAFQQVEAQIRTEMPAAAMPDQALPELINN